MISMTYLIAIPAYNEESTLSILLNEIHAMNFWVEFEIVVVNDGSRDKTEEIALRHWPITVLSHVRNWWVWTAFKTALEYFLCTHHTILITIDADRQFPVSGILQLIDALKADSADIAVCSRFSGVDPINMPRHKYLLNKRMSKFLWIMMSEKIVDITCGFRAYTKHIALQIQLFSDFTYTQEVIIDAIAQKARIARVPIEVTYYAERKSRVVSTVFGYMKKSALIILRTVRDARPLHFFWLPGFWMILVWFIFLVYFIVQYLLTLQTTPHRTWFISWWFLMLFGFILISIALLSDMMKRHRQLSGEILKNQRRALFCKESLHNPPFSREVLILRK